MTSTSITNGWDAICAFDTTPLNGVFLQQFLLQTQNTYGLNVRCAILDPSENGLALLVDVLLGPPQVSVPSDLSAQQLDVTMTVISGQLVQVAPAMMGVGSSTPVLSMLNVAVPPQSEITGPVSLGEAPGKDILGTVVLNLASGAYEVNLQGIAPGSPVNAALGVALQSFFATAPVQYVLATVAQSNAPAPLQPQSFDFYLQTSPDGAGDGALLLYIRTTGNGGTVGPMSPYPILSGSDSVAIIAGNVVLFGVIMEGLNTLLQPLGITLSPGPDSLNPMLVSQGDAFGVQLENDDGYSCGPAGDKGPVVVPVSMMISQDGPQFSFTCFSLVEDVYWYSTSDSSVAGPVQLTVEWYGFLTPSLDMTTGVVSFSSPGLPQVMYPPGSLTDIVGPLLQTQLNAAFQNFALPPIDTFAITNLIFANPNAFVPQSMSFPYDVIVNGNVGFGLQFDPPSTMLAVTSGATQTYSVSYGGQAVDAGDVLWEVSYGPGSISNGVYTPSPDAPMPAIVVVAGVLASNTNVTGSALLIVYELSDSGELTIDPPSISLTAGSQYTFTASADVDVTLSPNVGSVTVGDTAASFTYTAPDTIDDAQTVKIIATSVDDSSQSGTAKVRLVTMDETVIITLNSGSSALQPGQSALLAASGDEVDSFTWFVYPPGFGSVVPTASDGSTATYTAPALATESTQVTVFAFGSSTSVVGAASWPFFVV